MKKLVFVSALFIVSCSPSSKLKVSEKQNRSVIEGKIFASAYQQFGAEYRALCYQAYNLATEKLDQLLAEKTNKPKAIMTDIDETILNNSPYEVHQLLQGKDYTRASWKEWTARGEADTIPGALKFFEYTASKGVEVFYVSNRGEDEMEGTLKNLKKYNFPFADKEHILLVTNSSSKEPRKESIEKDHSILLLLGDNLNDFGSMFEKQLPDKRSASTDTFSSEFGNRFIVLPNPVYGDWEFSIYHYNYSLSPAQKDSAIRSVLKGY